MLLSLIANKCKLQFSVVERGIITAVLRLTLNNQASGCPRVRSYSPETTALTKRNLQWALIDSITQKAYL